MYKVKITEIREKRQYTKTIDFTGELTDEVKKQWDNIIKYEPENRMYTFISYSNKQEEKANEQI